MCDDSAFAFSFCISNKKKDNITILLYIDRLPQPFLTYTDQNMHCNSFTVIHYATHFNITNFSSIIFVK